MIVQEIKDEYHNAKVDCCTENKCKLHVDTGKNFVILKGELLVNQSKKICDCIIFHDDEKIALVELKSHNLDVTDIIEKLTNAGKESSSIATSHGANDPLFFVILLAKSYKNYVIHDKIQKATVKIQGKSYSILAKKCGDSLKKIINAKT